MFDEVCRVCIHARAAPRLYFCLLFLLPLSVCQVAANVEGARNAGNAILYEAVNTIMGEERQGGAHHCSRLMRSSRVAGLLIGTVCPDH